MSDPVDPAKVEELRSRLYDYVSSNPTGEHAAQARQILGTLPAKAASETPGANMPQPAPRNLTDEQAGAASGPLYTHRRPAGGTDFASERSPKEAANAEGEMNDPGARELLMQAETMPGLHMIGLGLSGLGRKMMGPAAEKFANSTIDVAHDAVVKTGRYAGQKVGEALDQIKRLRAAAPERAAFYNGEEERILEGATSPPEAPAPGGFDLGHLAPLAGHGPTGLALRMAAAAPAAVGDVAGRGLVRGGQQLAGPMSLAGSPLLQAVSGRE